MRRSVVACLAYVLGLALVLVPRSAVAWNEAGHMVVAAIAYQDLKVNDPGAIPKIVAILKEHPAYDQWEAQIDKPAFSAEDREIFLFMLAARWPDEVRGVAGEDNPEWHYVNFPYSPGAPSSPEDTVEPDESNILQAYRENLEVLKDPEAEAADKAISLCWNFHLLGDIHQPLHTTKLVTTQYPMPEGDRGGTRFYIKAKPNSTTIHIHKYWDDLVMKNMHFQSVRNRATGLRNRTELQRTALPELAEPAFIGWAKESYVLAKEKVYRSGTVGGSKNRHNGTTLPTDYSSDVKPIAERRVTLSGYRLSDLMKSIY
jgi:hypothetical protein